MRHLEICAERTPLCHESPDSLLGSAEIPYLAFLENAGFDRLSAETAVFQKQGLIVEMFGNLSYCTVRGSCTVWVGTGCKTVPSL